MSLFGTSDRLAGVLGLASFRRTPDASAAPCTDPAATAGACCASFPAVGCGVRRGSRDLNIVSGHEGAACYVD